MSTSVPPVKPGHPGDLVMILEIALGTLECMKRLEYTDEGIRAVAELVQTALTEWLRDDRN